MEDTSSGDMGIAHKYQRLAAEYSKLRSQLIILKKAVSEEQAKTAELKEQLKGRDQTIRKLEQEVECLNFRNQQLTKRIVVLQDDLEDKEEKSKKNKKKQSPYAVMNQSVIDEELQSRIEENEKLHLQVSAAELEHNQAVKEMAARLEQLEAELDKKVREMNEAMKEQEAAIAKLVQEKAKLEMKLTNNEKELKEVKMKEESCQEELKAVQASFGEQLEKTARVLTYCSPFIDTKQDAFNAINVPVMMQHHRRRVKALLSELNDILPEVIQRLSALHSYMAQRIQLVLMLGLNSTHHAVLTKTLQHLESNHIYLRSLEDACAALITKALEEDLTVMFEDLNVSQVIQSLMVYERYLCKLLPYLRLSLEADSQASGYNQRLTDTDIWLYQIAVHVTATFNRLHRYLLLASGNGYSNKLNGCQVEYSILIRQLYQTLYNLLHWFEEAKKGYGVKLVAEHQLPTVTDEVKSMDDSILGCLSSIVTLMKKLCGMLEHNLATLCAVPFRQRGILVTSRGSPSKRILNPVISNFYTRGMNYISSIKMEPCKAVSYHAALENSQSLQLHTGKLESISQQLSTYKTKVTNLEQEKEHWMLECQLLRVKFEREGKDKDSNLERVTSTTKDEVISFLRSRISQLVAQMQAADSKAVAFYAEIAALQHKLHLAAQSKETQEKDLHDGQLGRMQLQEELILLKKNYEGQLSTMSEHLASMNEKLTTQKDEIDALRQSVNNKGNKKSKPK